MGVELFPADRQTDRHDEDNSLFRNFANSPETVYYSELQDMRVFMTVTNCKYVFKFLKSQ
jgi:phosphosulfolactate phosphohydrolase-like enzyme